jgi:integrase
MMDALTLPSEIIVSQVGHTNQDSRWLLYFDPDLALVDFRNYLETLPGSKHERHTVRAYMSSLADFCRHLGAYVIHHGGEDYTFNFQTMRFPSRAAVTDYMAYCKRQRRSSKTIVRYMAAVRQWLRALEEQEISIDNGADFVYWTQAAHQLRLAIKTRNPAPDVTTNEAALDQTGTRLSLDQVEKVFNYFETQLNSLDGLRDLALIYLGIISAFRASELARVTLNSIQKQEKGYIVKVRGKRNNSDGVEIDDLAYDLIIQWVNAWNDKLDENDSRRITRETPVFQPLLRGGHIPQIGSFDVADGISSRAVLLIVKRRTLAALDFSIGAHDMRRTCAALMRQYGSEWEDIQTKLRHKSIATTQRYVGHRKEFGRTLLTNKVTFAKRSRLVVMAGAA